MLNFFVAIFWGGKWATLIPWSIAQVCFVVAWWWGPYKLSQKNLKMLQRGNRVDEMGWLLLIYKIIPPTRKYYNQSIYVTHYSSWHSICYSWRVLTLELRHDSSEFDIQSSWWQSQTVQCILVLQAANFLDWTSIYKIFTWISFSCGSTQGEQSCLVSEKINGDTMLVNRICQLNIQLPRFTKFTGEMTHVLEKHLQLAVKSAYVKPPYKPTSSSP